MAVIAENLSHENVQHYINPARIDKMHKVVLEAKNEAELLKIGEKLKEGNIPYKLWVSLCIDAKRNIVFKPRDR